MAGAVAGAVLSAIDWLGIPVVVVCGFLAGFRARSALPAAVLSIAVAAVAVIVAFVRPSATASVGVFSVVLVGAGMLPWFTGRLWQLSRALARAGWERAAQAQREMALIGEQARLRERLLIARDMHDGLGHELNLIALSAGALQVSDGLSAEHRDTARQIRTRAAVAVDHLGEVIGVLRSSSGASAARDVVGLVEDARAAGLRIELQIAGSPSAAPRMVQHAVYRVVQEGLTNVAKHAPGSTTYVVIGFHEAHTEMSLTNGPVPVAANSAGNGSGLMGLAERVRSTGGRLSHHRLGDEFVVRAWFPNSPAALGDNGAPIPEIDSGPRIIEQRQRGRSHLRMVAVSAVVVPLATGAVLTGGLRIWEAMTVRSSVLDATAFDRFRVGQHRSTLANYLPPQQLAAPPAPSPAPGTVCEYYAITANPFDDHSGDVYRLCFRAVDDVLVGLDVIAGGHSR